MRNETDAAAHGSHTSGHIQHGRSESLAGGAQKIVPMWNTRKPHDGAANGPDWFLVGLAQAYQEAVSSGDVRSVKILSQQCALPRDLQHRLQIAAARICIHDGGKRGACRAG